MREGSLKLPSKLPRVEKELWSTSETLQITFVCNDTGEGGLERGKGAAVDSPGPADGNVSVKLLTAG